MLKIMLKSSLNVSQRITRCMKFSSRSGKAFKYLPPPVKTSFSDSNLPPPTKIDEKTADLLERISLVGFKDGKGIQIVEDAIRFADYILEVKTEDVKPLVTVLEDEALRLREDTVNLDVTRSELLSHSSVTEENYYTTPIGNRPYVPEQKSMIFELEKSEKVCQN